MNSKISTKWIVLAIIVVGVILTSVFLLQGNSTPPTEITPSPTVGEEMTSTVSAEEQQQIDAWIEKNDLNEFGDPKEAAYAGGTPLFDEASGETKDRYEYIVESNPDRPWAID